MRLRNSFWTMLGRNVSEPPDAVVERVRQAMLFAVDTHCLASGYAMENKISYAPDINSLWYLRSDLMHAIASDQGEAIAAECVAAITTLFAGYQPGGNFSRQGGL
jgi:hypothetical protein